MVLTQQQPLISVIVPVYNKEKELPACIDSLLNQVYQNFEIILSDDGSTDNSPAICDEYAAKDSRIRAIHKKNGGLGSARNAGLSICQGEYVSFCDSDDHVEPDFLSTLYANLAETDSDISICTLHPVDVRLGTEPPRETSSTRFVFERDEAIQNCLICKYYAGSCCVALFKRATLENLRFREDLAMMEDVPFTVAAMYQAHRVCYTRKELYNYMLYPNTLSRSDFNERYLTLISACLGIIDFFKENNSYPQFKEYVDTRLVSCALAVIRKTRNNPEAIKKHAPAMAKIIRKHISLKVLKHQAVFGRISAILVCIHYRLFLIAVRYRSKTNPNFQE